jgi:hypothetical protein
VSVALLAVLDAALRVTDAARLPDGPQAERRRAGIAAATSLNDLLIRHRLGWDDVVVPGSRLAKLCGRLGSAYAAEQEAAYDHAVRLILQRRTTWSELVRLPDRLKGLPSALDRAVARRGGAAGAQPRRDAPAPAARPDAPSASHSFATSPPEADWITTVQRLKEHAAWRSEAEYARLDTLECRLFAGHAMGAEDAIWLRDLWWYAELHSPVAAEGRR